MGLTVASLLLLIGLLPAPLAVAQADLEVTGGGPGSASPGDTLSYSFTVTNLGPGNDPAVTFYVRPEFAYDLQDANGLETLGLLMPGDGSQPDCGDDLSNPAPWAFNTTQGTCTISPEYCDSTSTLWPALHIKCEIGGMLAGASVTVTASLPLTMSPPPEADLVFTQPAGMGDWVMRSDDPTHGFLPAQFGSSLYFGPPVTGDLILTSDGISTRSRGCGVWFGNYTGKIALIERGDCEFGAKGLKAQLNGAAGAIIYNTYPFDDPLYGGYINMAAGSVGSFCTIPAVFVPREAGWTLKKALRTGTVTLTLGPQFPLPWYQETLAFVYYNAYDPNPGNDSVLDVVEVGGPSLRHGLEPGNSQGASTSGPRRPVLD